MSKFITALKGSQEQFDRFCKIVEKAVALYVMFAAVWTICDVVGEILTKMGVA